MSRTGGSLCLYPLHTVLRLSVLRWRGHPGQMWAPAHPAWPTTPRSCSPGRSYAPMTRPSPERRTSSQHTGSWLNRSQTKCCFPPLLLGAGKEGPPPPPESGCSRDRYLGQARMRVPAQALGHGQQSLQRVGLWWLIQCSILALDTKSASSNRKHREQWPPSPAAQGVASVQTPPPKHTLSLASQS